MNSATVQLGSLEETLALGRRLGAALQAGDVVALIGPLGSGKTTLTKGIAAGAGVREHRSVNSPTFVIINEYLSQPGLKLYHIDAYRLRGPDDLAALGFDEMTGGGAVLLEWADRVSGVLPRDHLAIRLEPTGETSRRFHLSATGLRAAELLAAMSL